MDKFGVPKKVNRHVIKAINELNYQGLENPNLSNIFGVVELSMKNTVPVGNLQSLVRQSLNNLFELGVIQKQGTHNYKIRTFENVETFPSKPSKHIDKRIFKKVVRNDEESSTLNPNNRKRAVLSEDSIPENDPESSIKRLRTGKTLSRKGTNVFLPKVRKHHSNCQILMEHDCCCSSSCGHKSEDEKENIKGFSSTELKPELNSEVFEPAMVEEKGFDHNSDNLQKSVNDGNHQITESQTQGDDQLNKCADGLVNSQADKLEVLNENMSQLEEGTERKNKLECVQSSNNDEQKESKSQLDEGAESKISSKCNQSKNNEEQKEPNLLDTKEADITNVMTKNENTMDESIDQSIEIRNEFIENNDKDKKSNCD